MTTQILTESTNQSLASYSNLALYSTMVVFAIAMVMFAVDLANGARWTTAGDAVGGPRREGQATGGDRELVPASAVAADGTVPGGGSARTPDPSGRSGPVRLDGTSGTGTSGPQSRPRQWAGMAMSLSWLGAMLLVLTCALRGLSVQRAPLGNLYEFAIVGSAFVMAVFLGLSVRRDVRWLGLFVVGPVLLTLGLALSVFYTDASQLLPALKSFWLVIHVTVATLAVGLFTVAFSVTILSLIKAHREQRPPAKPGFMEALPSSAALERTAYGLHVVAFPLWTFTLIAGAIWAEQAWGHYWNWDPKEVWTFVIWVVYAAYLHARATTGWSDRKSSYLALAGYGCILVNYLVVNFYFVGQHSYSGM